MSLVITAQDNQGHSDYEPLATGQYNAVCSAIAAVGPVNSPYYKNISNKVYIKFEAEKPDGTMGEIWMGETQSLSSKSNLGNKLRNWRQKDFSPEELKEFRLVNILGVPAKIDVTQTTTKAGKPFAKITNIYRADKPMKASETWTYDVDDPAQTNYDKLPKFIKNVIEENKEYNHANTPSNSGDSQPTQAENVEVEDNLFDIPF